MSRALKISLLCVGLVVAGVFGYWFGAQRASSAYGENFVSEAFTREFHEARHDFSLLEALTQQKYDAALQVAQYRYYSRLILAADLAKRSSNPNLERILQPKLIEAREFTQAHPYRFPSEKEQNEWTALLKPRQ